MRAEEGIETWPGLGIGKDGIPSFVLLAGQQKSGEVRHFFALVGRKSLAKFGDFGGTHDGRLVDSAWEFNLETEMEHAWEWKPCPVREAGSCRCAVMVLSKRHSMGRRDLPWSGPIFSGGVRA